MAPEKNVEKRKKETENRKRKKMVQLNELLEKESSEEDIRGWVNGQGDSENSESGEGESEEEDEIDEVDLSSEGSDDEEG